MKKTISLVLLLFISIAVLSAASYDYVYYRTQMEVGKNAVHKIREDFIADFHTPSHGLYRFIPYNYKDAKVYITDLNCSEPFVWDRENGNVVMKIGSESQIVSGEKQYAISYSYDVGEDSDSEYDYVYFNLFGTDYDCYTDCFEYEVFIPCEGLNLQDLDVNVTGGYYGSSQKIPYNTEKVEDVYKISGKVYDLHPYQGISIRILLPEGWFENARKLKDFRNTFGLINIAGSLVLVALAFVIWNSFGRDRIPIITARFNPPENFSPLFVGYLADERTDDKDITSMLFYWADKGYIKITEPKKKHYEFTKLNNLPNDVPSVEREIFYGFFKGCDANGTIKLSDLQHNDFYQVMLRAKLLVPKYFRGEKKLKDSKASFFSFLLGVLAIIPLCFNALSLTAHELMADEAVTLCLMSFVPVFVNSLAFVSLMKKWYVRKHNGVGIAAIILLIAVEFVVMISFTFSFDGFNIIRSAFSLICSATISFMAVITEKKSEYWAKIYEETLGFREYIEKVSMAELVTMIDEDPMYYYHILCYAIVLGLENTWAKKFASVAVPPPVWYAGISPFDVYFYSSFASHVCRSVATSAIPVQKTNSIGAGGIRLGGFSGGGFGGGGSRAW